MRGSQKTEKGSPGDSFWPHFGVVLETLWRTFLVFSCFFRGLEFSGFQGGKVMNNPRGLWPLNNLEKLRYLRYLKVPKALSKGT